MYTQTYQDILRCAQLLQHQSEVIEQQGVIGSPAQHGLVMPPGLGPPPLQTTQVAHVCVGIDVVCLDGEGSPIAGLGFLRTICCVFMLGGQ